MSKQRTETTAVKKVRAMELRTQGLSYKEIAKAVHVSMGSLSCWLQGIELTEEQRRRLQHREQENWKRGGERVRQVWEEKRREIRSAYQPPLHDPRFMLGLGLYWGEGKKFSASDVSMGNTSPKVLKAYIAWIRWFFPFKSMRFSVHVQHHQGAAQDEDVKRYWSDELGIPLACFLRCHHVKPRSDRPPRRSGYGIAAVRVCGKGAWVVRQKIQVALDKVASMM